MSVKSDVPDCLVVLFFSRAGLKETILANEDRVRLLCDRHDRETHLRAAVKPVLYKLRAKLTFETQLSIIVAMSRPAEN